MPEENQTGKLFSEVYYPKLELTSDDPRARKRIAAVFRDLLSDTECNEAAHAIRLRLGIDVPHGEGTMGIYYRWEEYFEDIAIADLLNSITVIFRVLSSFRQAKWRDRVEQIFRQQALAYETDEKCGVRLYVDEDFSKLRLVTLRLLEGDRHKVALGHFKDFENCLYGDPVDFRNALRHFFETIEDVFKRMSDGKESRLDPSSAKSRMINIVSATYSAQEQTALNQMVSAFSKWVAAASQYRHAAGGNSIPTPGRSTAILMISTGLAYLRWMLEIDEEHSTTQADP